MTTWKRSRHLFASYRWGDERILFLQNSGETHYINPAATMVLEILAQQPTTLIDLSQQLSERGQVLPSEAVLEDLLDRFTALGLLEEC